MHPALLQQLRNSVFKHTFRSVCKKNPPSESLLWFSKHCRHTTALQISTKEFQAALCYMQLPPAAVTWHSRLLTNPHPSLLPSRSHRAASQPRNPVQGRAVRPEFHVSSCRGLVLVSNLTVLLSAAPWDERTGKQRSSFY